MACALLGAVLIIRSGNRWAYVLAGAATAIALLARLQAVAAVIVPIVLAHGVVWWRQPGHPLRFLLTQWLWAAAGFVVASIIINPFIILKPARVADDINFIFEQRYTAANDAALAGPTFAPLDSVRANWELPLRFLRPYLGLALIPALFMAVKKRDVFLSLTGITLVIFVVSLLPAVGPRVTFWLPAVIPLSVCAGAGAYNLLREAAPARWLGAGVVGVVLLLSLGDSLKIDLVLARTNTQMLAYDTITATLPPGARILQGNELIYSVPLARNNESLNQLRDYTAAEEAVAPVDDYFLNHPDRIRQPAYTIFGPEYRAEITSDASMRAFLAEYHVDYIIEADYCGGTPAYADANSQSFPVITESVRADLVLVYAVSPFGAIECQQVIESRTHMEMMRLNDWQRTGPLIRVYRVP